ncbi:hypothetical protein GCM10027614_68370 [Micromonospora vulcania]
MTTTDQPVDVLLSDGSTVQLRPISPDDAPDIVAMHGRFSERTRYLRYFSPYPRIPERDLIRFVTVDHHDREAYVVLAADRIVAVGRYERLGPQAPEAEVAFVVEDAHQGRGIGSVLMEHLADAARRNGIMSFVAEVLPANGTMLRVFADFGYQVQREYADGVVHLSFPIAPTEATLEVQRGREHRTEARSIARLLAPRGIAVYGASASGQGIGAAVLGHLRDGGFTGAVVPVHPNASTVAGLPAYTSGVDAGVPLDLAVVAVPPEAATAVVADAAAAGAHGLVVISAGFAEAGAEGAATQRALVRAAHAAACGSSARTVSAWPTPIRRYASTPPSPRHYHRPVGSASSASPARSGWRCSPRPTGAASGCPASSRPATGPTSPATICFSTGRTTPAPT